MALSGSVVTTSCEGRSVTLKWTATQNIANNTSTISWELVGSGSNDGWVQVSEISIEIDGNEVYYRSSSNHTECYIGTELCSGSTTITHALDGTRSFDISVGAGIYQNSINCTGNGNFTLNTIARATQPSVSPTSAYIGNNITISMPRASSSFTHTLTYSFGSSSGTIGTGLGTSKTWTVPASLASAISNAKSGPCTITCKTYSGSTLVGTKTCSVTLVIPASTITASASSVFLGDSVTFSIARIASNIKHTLTYSFGTKTGTIGSSIDTSKAWAIPASLTHELTNASSGKCTITCQSYNGSALVGSRSFTVNLVIPSTVPTISAASTYIGKDLTITMPRIAGNLTHTLTYTYGNATGTIGTGLAAQKVWTLPASLANQLVNASSGRGTIICKTYNGTALVGSRSVKFKAVIPTTIPTLSASSIYMNSDLTITLPRVSSNLTHALTYEFGSATGTIGSGLGASKEWTVPISLANQIPRAVTGSGTITCKTYNGTALIGTKTISFKASVPTSVIPTISSLATSDPSGCLTKYGNYVQNKSRVKIDITAAGAYSSTITSYKIVANGSTYNTRSATTGTLLKSGTYTITATVTDSRGRTASKTATISAIAYNVPTATLNAYRCNSDGTANEEGAYFKATFTGSATALNNKNSKTFTLQYKEQSETSWTTAQTYTSAYSVNTYKVIAVDTEKSYNVRFVAKDDFASVTKSVSISAAFVLIDFAASGRGVAIGKVAENNEFDVNLISRFRQSIYMALNRAIYTNEIDGTVRSILMPYDDNGDTTIGYGNYKNKSGTTIVYGHDVQISMSSGSSKYGFRPYYRKGDSLGVQGYTSGFVTNSGTEVWFNITMNNKIAATPTITITSASNGGLMVRQGGKYCYGGDNTTFVKPSSYTVGYDASGTIRIKAKFSNTTNIINNDVVGIHYNCIITFS